MEGRKNGREGLPSFLELCHFLLQPSATRRGKRFIRSIDKESEFYSICIKGYEPRIYWPISWGLWTFGMVLSEQFDPHDWHYYQVSETKLRADDIVVDCGAAEGLFSLVASTVCKHCYCVEPAPAFQPFLQRTFREIGNVEILPFLLSDYIGDTHMEALGISSKETLDATAPSVPATTMDAIFFEKDLPFTYLKADVEGAEMQLLEGARKSIKRFRPRVVITTYHNPAHSEQIKSFLHGVHSDYKIRVKGIVPGGQPVMLHAW
jgi:FkbM family methyltransferase